MNKWEAAICDQLDGSCPWSDPNDQCVYDGLERQLQQAPADERQALVKACGELLIHGSLPVRSGIISALVEMADDLGAEWLAEQWVAHPALFLNIPPVEPSPFPTLEKGLFRAIAHAVKATDQQALALLRQVATESDWGAWVLLALAKVDSDWVVAHAKTVIPHQMVSILLPLNPQQRRLVIAQLAPWPPEVLTQISPAYWRQFAPDEARELQQLMCNTLPLGIT